MPSRPDLAHDAARAPGDFRDLLRPEALDDLVERARHRRQASKMRDQLIAALHSLAALDRLAVHARRGREQILPSSSEYSSKSCVGKECSR